MTVMEKVLLTLTLIALALIAGAIFLYSLGYRPQVGVLS